MGTLLMHRIWRNPKPEDVGTIRVLARVVDGSSSFSFFWASSFVEEFLADDNDQCQINVKNYLMESGISDDDSACAMRKLVLYVAEVTWSASSNYSPGCALDMYMSLRYNPQIEEAIRVSFDETSNIRFKPASKLVVKSLTRKIYQKISSTGETCTICLQEFNNGGRLVTLPCGHEFDDECAVKWFETSHFCPLCRNKLPCEDQ